MSRPIYETTAAKAAEVVAALDWAVAHKLDLLELGPMSEFDYAALRGGKVVGLVEVKCRSKRYPDLLLSLRKLATLQGVNGVLVVKWPDGLYWARARDLEVECYAFGGRTDRGDELDQELCAFLGLGAFKRVRGPSEVSHEVPDPSSRAAGSAGGRQ